MNAWFRRLSANEAVELPTTACALASCSSRRSQHKLAGRDDEAQFIDSTATTPFAWFPD
jgi:hypothetical protein